MKVLISGGAGFIGSHYAHHILLEKSFDEVVIYDNFSSGTLDHLKHITNDPRLRIVDADIKHLGLLTNAMKNVDLVAHFAANPDISKASKFPDIDFWEGTYLTQNILEAMRINEVRNMIYTSGSGVYGEVPGQKFSETYGPCFPISTYGASKLACEALISSYCHMFSIRARAFRFANVVGPRQTHGVGYDFIRRLIQSPSSLRILGDGTQTKSYIHINDVINAIDLVWKNAKQVPILFDVFNVATDDYITVTEIANLACNALGLNKDLVNFEYTGGDRGWKGDVPRVQFNTQKIKMLGWRPQRNCQMAIEASLKAMRVEIQGSAI
jgi:UDP-glucose 4-epimerase